VSERIIGLKLPPGIAEPLLGVLLPLLRERGPDGLAIRHDLRAVEEDFREQWRGDLAEQLDGDCGLFLAAFDTGEFRTRGVVEFPAVQLDPLLRACSALRLKLRDRSLGAVADAALETGEVELARLNKEEQAAMNAYLFLAALQEILIRQLDPGASGGAD
jgi:hypothetical protein